MKKEELKPGRLYYDPENGTLKYNGTAYNGIWFEFVNEDGMTTTLAEFELKYLREENNNEAEKLD